MATLWFQLGELEDWVGFDEPLLVQDIREAQEQERYNVEHGLLSFLPDDYESMGGTIEE